MRALICKNPGPIEDLVLEADWPEAEVADNEVKIRVHAAGLNFPDVLTVQGKYQTQPEPPFIPGTEAAGVVTEVGKAVKGINPGDKVVAIGMGAFAETMTVAADFVMPMPEGLSFEQAAGISITYLTSYHALKQCAQLRSGESLLVLGAAGGVGITAVEIGKLMGAKVIAAASSDEKLQLAKKAGADILINYNDKPLKEAIREAVGKDGVDVVYDPVGGDYSEAALRCMAWKGRFLVIGFASGPIPKIPLNLALLKGCSIVGVFWGRFSMEEPAVNQQNIAELWQMFAEKKLQPLVSETYPLERYADAFATMAERRALGKVIITP